MKLNDLQNKKIAFLGLGTENQDLLRYLMQKNIRCQVVICDARNEKELLKKKIKVPAKKLASFQWKLGKDYDHNLGQYDIIFRIAGYPLFSDELKKVNKKKTIITSPTKLFFDICPSRNIIGVTGTNGKGTTSSLIYSVFKKAGKTAFIGGNIGVPMFSFFDKIKKNDWIILELSSFQLEDMVVSPHISVITNITPDHLAPANPSNPNFHKSFSAYQKAKENIFAFHKTTDYLVVNKKLTRLIADKKIKSKIIQYGQAGIKSALAGSHNQENIAAALAVAKIAQIKKSVAESSASNFQGLEYRLELIRNLNGVKYYNDSYSATPESTITAVNSFDCPIVLFLGGADKGSDFTALMEVIRGKNIKQIFLFNWKKMPPQSTQKILFALQKINFPQNKIIKFDNFAKAVNMANRNSVPGDVVLLSPGCGSFGMFKNFKERGAQYNLLVSRL